MLITEILARNARVYSEDIALIERDPEHDRRVSITWLTFNEQSNRLARALISKGIQKGDRVAQLMTNSIEWLPVYFGILRSGALAVPLNFRFMAETINRCIITAGASILVFGPEFIERITSIKDDLDRTVHTYIFVGPQEQCPGFAESYKRLISEYPPDDPKTDIIVTDDAAIYFTSGTTGTPKGVLLTHRCLESACIIENHHHRQDKNDNFLCIPPLYHTGAKMHWFGNFIVGAKAVILKGTEPRWILEAVSEEGVTIVWLLVPWALDILLAIESGELKLSRFSLDKWRLMHIGAQPVPPSLIKEWHKIFPHHQYDTNYGLTESTGPGCIHLGPENSHKAGAIGRPGFDWEHQVVDDQLNPVERGQAGELIIKGPALMKSYYRNPEATSEVLRDGWLLTGDIVREDEDGFIWLVDRKKDVIITGGENVYPVEIEDFLQNHPKIQDAAVIGLPSLRLGEIAAAIIKVKPDQELTKEDIRSYCESLPRYKRPRQIFFDEVLRNPTGKIDKPALRKKYTGIKESFKSE
ncbi:MAG: AMP-binding protein [Desulfobacteraceae bacterium]|nr:AMP-binding protein [Desulfobacteraceae bacterium]